METGVIIISINFIENALLIKLGMELHERICAYKFLLATVRCKRIRISVGKAIDCSIVLLSIEAQRSIVLLENGIRGSNKILNLFINACISTTQYIRPSPTRHYKNIPDNTVLTRA
jgi:hypothetical protein